jgi:pimeloyl-ACP methyl ester carboxylesterase
VNRILLLSLLALTWGLVPPAARASHGSVVEARLPSGKTATADFHAGKHGKPAVLILHGFLQTRTFPTVDSVMGALSTAGYTVVAPTLSLGISRRNRSLPCEALHLHAFDEDVAEVEYWVTWLMRKGYPRIVLVGHSFGNLQLLAYLGRTPSPSVKKLLMISLTDVEVKQDAGQRATLAKALKARVARNDRTLAQAELGHCQKYVGPPAALLSYMSLSRQGILDALVRSPVAAQAIMGGDDERMGPDWVDTLAARGIAVRVIPGATHFFDNQYEFDLQEAVLEAVAER